MEENGQNCNIEMERAELAKAEMLTHLTRSKKGLRVALTKLEKERDQNLKMAAFHNAKVQEMDIEGEQLALCTKVAHESEAVIRNKHSKLKSTYHHLAKANKESNESITELKNNINSMERVNDQQKATISGLRMRAGELAQANPSDAQLEELLDLKEEQLEEKDKEILETKEKITNLEMEKMAYNKLVAAHERSSSTMNLI